MRDREHHESSRDAGWLLHGISQRSIVLIGYGSRRATRPQQPAVRGACPQSTRRRQQSFALHGAQAGRSVDIVRIPRAQTPAATRPALSRGNGERSARAPRTREAWATAIPQIAAHWDVGLCLSECQTPPTSMLSGVAQSVRDWCALMTSAAIGYPAIHLYEARGCPSSKPIAGASKPVPRFRWRNASVSCAGPGG